MANLTIVLLRGPNDDNPIILYSFSALRDMLARLGLCVFGVTRKGRTLTVCGC